MPKYTEVLASLLFSASSGKNAADLLNAMKVVCLSQLEMRYNVKSKCRRTLKKETK